MRADLKSRILKVKQNRQDKKEDVKKGLEEARKMPTQSIANLRDRVAKLEDLFEQYIR